MKDNANCIQSQSILYIDGESYAFQSFHVSSIPTTSNNRTSMYVPISRHWERPLADSGSWKMCLPILGHKTKERRYC